MKTSTKLLIAGCVLLLLLQIGISFRSVTSDLIKVRKNIGQSGLWRSAKFFGGTKFANYITFLNENIPNDGTVLLPPKMVAPDKLATTPVMQFYLAPRTVINCSDLSCVDEKALQGKYVIIIKGFPPLDEAPSMGELIMFNDSWGVLRPTGLKASPNIVFAGFQSWQEIAWAALLPFVWLLILMIGGALIVAGVEKGLPWGLNVALGYGLGTAVFSLIISALSLFGVALNGRVIWFVTAFVLLASGGWFYMTKHRSAAASNTTQSEKLLNFDPETFWWPLIFMFIGVLSFVLSAGKSYHTTDAVMLWGAKGYGIAGTGEISAVDHWGTSTLGYPLHIPIMIAGFKLLFNEILPGSKFLFSGYLIALMFSVFYLLQKLGVKRIFAGGAVAMFVTTPLIFRHGMIAYANLPLTYYIVVAALLSEVAFRQEAVRHRVGIFLLSGLFFAGGAWVRPEGGLLAWLGIALFLIMYYVSKKKLLLRQLIALITPLLVYHLYWLWVKAGVYAAAAGKGLNIAGIVKQMVDGNWHASAGIYVFQSLFVHLFDLKIWGLFGFTLLLILLIAAFFRKLWFQKGLLWYGMLIVIGVMGVYYLLSYSETHDISWWVQTGLDRIVMPGIALVWFSLFGGNLFHD